jgi:hypothetical protein
MKEKKLIEKLSKEGAKKPLIKTKTVILTTCLSLILYLALLIFAFGLRQDFAAKILETKFQIELFLLISSALISASLISLIRLPDFNEKKYTKFLPILVLIGFLLLIAFEFFAQNEHGKILCGAKNHQCCLTILIFSAFPLILLLIILKSGIVTNFLFSTIFIGISGGTISYLLLRMTHETENITHLIIWHLCPIILVIFISGILIKIFTKKL